MSSNPVVQASVTHKGNILKEGMLAQITKPDGRLKPTSLPIANRESYWRAGTTVALKYELERSGLQAFAFCNARAPYDSVTEGNRSFVVLDGMGGRGVSVSPV